MTLKEILLETYERIHYGNSLSLVDRLFKDLLSRYGYKLDLSEYNQTVKSNQPENVLRAIYNLIDNLD